MYICEQRRLISRLLYLWVAVAIVQFSLVTSQDAILVDKEPGGVTYADEIDSDAGLNRGSSHDEGQEEPVMSRQTYPQPTLSGVVNPAAMVYNSLPPQSYVPDPDAPNILQAYDSCENQNGLRGICVPSKVCAGYGGQLVGGCSTRGVFCCANMIADCGGWSTINNTYWMSPLDIGPWSSCSLNVRLDPNLFEQKKIKICQIRLDFLSFSLNQPSANSQCNTDTFTVSGVSNNVSTLCGDNSGQHMYLWPKSTTSVVTLKFGFGTAVPNVGRSWNILISHIPCGSNNLAPLNCLQYYRSVTGTISSFNWKGVTVPAGSTRQLANQDYQICFRTELIDGLAAKRICYSMCPTANNVPVFSMTSTPAAATAVIGAQNCKSDYLIIRGGSETNFGEADRFCGTSFPQGGAGASLCSTVPSFNVVYRTDGSEAITEDQNIGFCLNFQQYK